FDLIQKSIPVVCVDLVILRNHHSELLLIKRRIEPETGKWCLIGGRVLFGEKLSAAIKRQAKRELGIKISVISPFNPNFPAFVEDRPNADPQKHAIALTYPVIISPASKLNPVGPEFSEAAWFKLTKLPKMGFNHKKTLAATIQRVLAFCPL
ncbi:MAG: NUDIX domain-containing protein, partial [Patescibacteria group bacterium]